MEDSVAHGECTLGSDEQSHCGGDGSVGLGGSLLDSGEGYLVDDPFAVEVDALERGVVELKGQCGVGAPGDVVVVVEVQRIEGANIDRVVLGHVHEAFGCGEGELVLEEPELESVADVHAQSLVGFAVTVVQSVPCCIFRALVVPVIHGMGIETGEEGVLEVFRVGRDLCEVLPGHVVADGEVSALAGAP